jgi:predicted metal-dependent hydrolase
MNTITYKDLTLQVHRSDRKRTVGLTIERDGSLIITAPSKASQQTLENIVQQKSQWIYKHLLKKQEINPAYSPKQYVTGEGFPYLGRSYRLKIIAQNNSEPLLKYFQGHFYLQTQASPKGKQLFIEWYKEHLLTHITKKIDNLTDRLGVTVDSIQIRELGNRWGSCGNHNKLNFHWRIAMLPHSVINYIVIHEMTHLKHHSHDQKFWQLIQRVLPDYQDQKAWLATHGKNHNL